MASKCVVFGATGMVGQALVREAKARRIACHGVARSQAGITCDVTDPDAIVQALETVKPDLVINAAALIDHELCERRPGLAYRVNARPVGIMAEYLNSHPGYFIQISTDNYYTGDGRKAHDETAPVRLLSEYARTKFAGEEFAKTAPQSLIVRTNVTGCRGSGKNTFFEWAKEAILDDSQKLVLFDDYYTSTIDRNTLARAIFDLAEKQVVGVLNVASSEVFSKKEFLLMLAKNLHKSPAYEEKSVSGLIPGRAESSGLCVRMAEARLGYELPKLQTVINSLLEE